VETTKIKTDSHSISCDGGGDLGHPTIYLEIPSTKKEIICPYCSQVFVYSGKK